jgi:hypothetical protein
MKKAALYTAIIVAAMTAIVFVGPTYFQPTPLSTVSLPSAKPAPVMPTCNAACKRDVDAEEAQDKADADYAREMRRAQSDLTSAKIDIERDGQEAQEQAAKAQRAAQNAENQ